MPIDPTIPPWVRNLVPKSIGHGLTRPIMVGPQPLSWRPQSVASDMGALCVKMSGIRLYGDLIRAFRALFFGTLALGQPVYVPMYDWRRGPRVRTGLPAFPSPATRFSDTSDFSDGTGFDADAPNITVAAVANARATSIVVQTGGDPLPTAGEFFGLGDRAYMTTAITIDGLPSGQTMLSFQPPLRYAAAVGDAVETADPVCRMQLDPKQVETILNLDLAIIGSIDLDFYEANWT